MACPDCARQFDASGREVASRFRCACGTTLTVPEARPHDAAVVRCSACGAPREKGAAACGFCGSDFTLHERDLHTICPSCMARISDRARYCHHCATPLLPQPLGPMTRQPCPACGEEHPLTGRRLGDEAVPILECQRCAGLWLASGAFDFVLGLARRDALTRDERAAAPRSAPLERQAGPLYRHCPECGVLMHRFNYGRRSGVIVDSCAAHGLWFDARELDELLLWVRRGGEAAAARRDGEEETQLRRQRALHGPAAREAVMPGDEGDSPPRLIKVLGEILGSFIG